MPVYAPEQKLTLAKDLIGAMRTPAKA